MCIYEIFCMCVHTYTYMSKSQSFPCRNYFCEVDVIAEGVSWQFCFQLLFYCTWRLSSSPPVQQEKPGQEVCWISWVDLPKCLLGCLRVKGVTGYGRVWMQSPITTVDCLLVKQLYRGKFILVSFNPKINDGSSSVGGIWLFWNWVVISNTRPSLSHII